MKRLSIVGIFFALAGIAFLLAGGAALGMAKAGKTSLQAVYKAQNLMMTYDANGNFTDREKVEGGNAILSLLTNDWKYPLRKGSLDPKNPLVNTPDEVMVQYARISYHTLYSTQTIVLDKDVDYKGQTYNAGKHDFAVDGRYWQDFDRAHPIEGVARSQAWSSTVLGLLASLQAGFASHTLVELAFYFSLLVMGLGMMFLIGGMGIAYAGLKERKK